MSHNPRVSIQTKITYPNTTNETYTFDALYNITKIQTAGQTLNYTHDKTGLITSKNSTNYTYDNIGRLTQAGSESFTYDKAGNNLNNNAIYDPKNNRFKQSDLYTITYDAMGNIKTKYNKLTKETTTYTFNARNQLISYTKQDENNQTVKTLEFAYDAFGRRVSKTEDGVTQKYLYDGDDIVAILDSNNAVIATITHDESIDTPLSITNANGTFYYHRDHQGSIVALTDSSGQVVESFTYDNHYGSIVNHTKTTETNNPYAYTGRELDTGELYYYRARYYDPTLKRFISEDPIGFASKDFNFYRYVNNNPYNGVDPSGLVSLETIWKNRPFVAHYFFGGGSPMTISPSSSLGRQIMNHLNNLINKRYQEAISHACESYNNTTIDPIDFTNIPDLFSIGNSNLKTKVFCGNGKCLVRFEIRDWFIDAKDIDDSVPGNQEYPLGRPYPINFTKVYTYGF